MHHHRTPVQLPDGSTVTAVSFTDADPYHRDPPPDFGLYLDHRWTPPWPHAHVEWPDFGLPSDTDAFVAALRAAHDRAQRGERVELGCLGGHGRTGTALSSLAVLAGVAPGDAVAWVRSSYCDRAVETPEQAAFVAALALD
jgi:protein-tyrosine phosphatase